MRRRSALLGARRLGSFVVAACASLGLLGGCAAPRQYREHSIPAMFRRSAGSIPLEVCLEPSPELVHLDCSLPRAGRRILLGVERDVYAGRVVLPLWGAVRREARHGSSATITVTATAQACNANSCLAPSEVRLSQDLKIVHGSDFDDWFFR